MYNVEDVQMEKCEESLYIRPARMLYTQNGRKQIWDLMKVHDSVSIIIHNTSRNVLLFVKQFRPAVYYNRIPIEAEDENGKIDAKKYSSKLGMTIELCAGIVDKDSSLASIAKDEILEECGYDVPLNLIQKITSYRSGVGIAGSLQTLFYAEVTDNMRVSGGGGNYHEGEFIEVVEYSIPETRAMMMDEEIQKPVSLLYASMWFFENKVHPKILQKL